MLAIIAPTGSGKSHTVKSLIKKYTAREDGSVILREISYEKNLDQAALVVYDLDCAPEVRGVYSTLGKRFGSVWWTSSEALRVKDELLARAFGNVAKRLPPNGVVLTAEKSVVHQSDWFALVLPSVKQLLVNMEARKMRPTGQPILIERDVVAVQLEYAKWWIEGHSSRAALTHFPELLTSSFGYALNAAKYAAYEMLDLAEEMADREEMRAGELASEKARVPSSVRSEGGARE